MADALDELAQFEKFKSEIAPKIRGLVQKGASAQEIMEFAQSYAAARMVSEIFNSDSAKAMTAAKDVIDRAVGKAKERKEHTHKYDGLSDEELTALVNSEEDTVLGETNEH